MYRLLGFENTADLSSPAEIQAVETPPNEAPFLKQKDENPTDLPFATCDVSKFSQYIGTSFSLIQDTIDLSAKLRIIYPNRMITTDYQASRVNLVLNDNGQVDRIYCG